MIRFAHISRQCPKRDFCAFGQKERSIAGFTLVEMLAALVVLMLLTGIVVMGVDLGSKTYQQSRFSSESEILHNTIDSALSDPFRNMTYTSTADSNNVVTKTYSIIYRDDSSDATIKSPKVVVVNGQIYLQGTNTSGNGVPLLNSGAYSDCNIADFSLLSCTDEEVSGTYVIQSRSDSNLSNTYAFKYRPIYPAQKTS